MGDLGGPRGKSVKNQLLFNGSGGSPRGPWEDPESARSIMYCNLQGLLENAKLRRIHSQQIGSCQKHMSVYVESECDQNSDFESCSKKTQVF